MFSSQYISQSIQSQNSMFSQNAYGAQQMSMGSGQMMPPPAPVPPPPAMSQLLQGNQGGQFGERLAYHGAGTAMGIGSTAMGAASLMGGLGMLGGAGRMLDPFGMAMGMGKMGFAAGGGGMMGAAVGIGAAALPMGLAYAGTRAVGAYTDAFKGGMQDQFALNSTLRNNFNFLGGSRGRGFTQGQMGDIGGVMQQELNSNFRTNAGELNSLISQGAQSGMFTGTQDVSGFKIGRASCRERV